MSATVDVKRQLNLDLLRITACFLVILLHVANAYWGWGDMYQPGWTGITTYTLFTRCCVPIFVMISGKLFLSRNTFPISKLLLQYVLKLVILYTVWGLLYALDDAGLKVIFSGSWQEIFNLFITSPKYHLWYLPMQTCVYLMIPVFWAVAKYADGKYLEYICILACVFNVVNTIIWVFNPTSSYANSFLGYFASYIALFYIYFLLGYYLSTKKLDKVKVWHCLFVYAASSMIATVYTVWSSRSSRIYDASLLDVYPTTSFIASIALFVAFQKMHFVFSENAGKVIAVISRCTLFIYLFHPFVLDRLQRVGIDGVMFNPWVCIPVVSLIIFVICLLPALVLTRIPVINKWLL